MNKKQREEYLKKLGIAEERVKLLSGFWEWCPDEKEVHISIFWVSAFIGWLQNEGLQITPREFQGIH